MASASLKILDGRMTASVSDWVGLVVATDVGRGTLDGDELADDGLLLLGQSLGENGECVRQVGVHGLRGQFLGPVEGQVEVATPIVDATEATARGPVLLEERARRPVEGVGEDLGACIAGRLGQMLEADGEGKELTQAVPAQVVLLEELLHVLRRRATGARLEESRLR